MALSIKAENNQTIFDRYIPFEDHSMEFILMAPHVEFIQVDGHELEYIQDRFINNGNGIATIPSINEFVKIMRWYGDDAKFIIGNLI